MGYLCKFKNCIGKNAFFFSQRTRSSHRDTQRDYNILETLCELCAFFVKLCEMFLHA